MATTGSSFLDVNTLQSLDDREIRALAAVMDASTLNDAEVRASLAARLNEAVPALPREFAAV